MSVDRIPIRSYQRIFRPERRIYQVEGHRLPVPGGVPLRWVGYAVGALLTVIVLSSRSIVASLVLASLAALAGLAFGGRAAALVSGATVLGGAQVAGFLIATMDWPLRLLVLPALVATLATQATPDGRAAHRYALSWIGLQLRPLRRSLDRAVPAAGEAHDVSGAAWIKRDEHGAAIRRARVHGPAVVQLATPLTVRRARFRSARLTAAARPPRHGDTRATRTDRVQLAAGETLELRP